MKGEIVPEKELTIFGKFISIVVFIIFAYGVYHIVMDVINYFEG